MIPDSVTTLSQSTFLGCTNLESVTIGAGITVVGSDAFAGCSSLANVQFSNNLTVIGDAFSDCISLTTVSIPQSVTSIAQRAFSDCPNLELVLFDGPPPSHGHFAFQNTSPDLEIRVWPEHVAAYGGEGALWNGLPVQLRGTSPNITSLTFEETSTNLSISGGPDRTYVLQHSTDLINFSQVTTPEPISTDSSGTTSVTVNTPGDKGFFVLEEVLP